VTIATIEREMSFLREEDENFIEEAEAELRRQRRQDLGQLTLGRYVPMVGRCMDESARCYIHESFVASVVMSALAVEIGLRHLIREKKLKLRQDVDRMDFVQLIDWAYHLDLLDYKQFENADRLRRRRNHLLHFRSFERIVKKEATMKRLNLDERNEKVKSQILFSFGIEHIALESYKLAESVLCYLFPVMPLK